MKKQSLYPVLLPLLLLLVALNLPRSQSEAIKGYATAILTKLWGVFDDSIESQATQQDSRETLLELEIAQLKSTVQQELTLLEKLAGLQNMTDLDQHKQRILQDIQTQIHGIAAKIIYRSPTVWSSSLWINKGTEDGIAKDSPVLSKGSLIGVVDYVGASQSRIRLITDSGLTISVRAARNASMKEKNFIPTSLLAKGELSGSSKPLWRSPGQLLKGIGFNYDYADEEGPARDLRTGAPEGSLSVNHSEPLIKLRDILVTTGYDGIFPAGIPVAEVIKIHPLGEGDYFYTLEAKPTADNLDDLSHVLVLPPQGYDKKDQPPAMIW